VCDTEYQAIEIVQELRRSGADMEQCKLDLPALEICLT